MSLNQAWWEVSDPNELDTPPEGQVNVMVDESDNTIWGRFSDGVLRQFTSESALTIVGTLNPGGGNIDYPAAQAGDVYIFNSDGTIGAPPIEVEAGEVLICTTDSAGGAGAASDFTIQQLNVSYATTVNAGIIRLVTNALIEAGADDLAAVTTAKLYYLLQTYGIEWILTDEVRGRVEDGSLPLRINPRQNSAIGGPQSSIQITTPKGPNAAAAVGSTQAGDIYIVTGSAGDTVDGNGGPSGFIEIQTGAGSTATGTGNGGDSNYINIITGTGGSGVNGGNVPVLSIIGGMGGSTNAAAGNGGGGGDLEIRSGQGGNSSNAGSGGQGGNAGQISIVGGTGGSGTGLGGVSDIGGAGGDIEIIAGDTGESDLSSGTPGSLELRSGSASDIANGANGSQTSGGTVTITSGNGNTSSTGFPGEGGRMILKAGNGQEQVIDGGAGSNAGNGGLLSLLGGNGANGVTSAGVAGGIVLNAGITGSTTGAGSDAPSGGGISITASNGGIATGAGADGGDGGRISLIAGTGGGSASGSDGADGFITLEGFTAKTKVEDSITAGAGGGFANAYEMQGVYNRIKVAANPNDSVKLPKTPSGIVGSEFYIRNDSANTVRVFANNGTDTINGAVSRALPAGSSAKIVKMTATEFYVFD